MKCIFCGGEKAEEYMAYCYVCGDDLCECGHKRVRHWLRGCLSCECPIDAKKIKKWELKI